MKTFSVAWLPDFTSEDPGRSKQDEKKALPVQNNVLQAWIA